MATGHTYYAECPNPNVNVEIDKDLNVDVSWVCTWFGMPDLKFHRDGLTCRCLNCGYTWEISYREFWYGDGLCPMKHMPPSLFSIFT